MKKHFQTSLKKKNGGGRSMAQESLDLIKRMRAIAQTMEPITGRGIGYKLFADGLITSMETSEMQRVYRLLRIAREQGHIPWEWIVDEGRELERVATWEDPAEYAIDTALSYRRDFWTQQPRRCEVWSEKGTVRGVLQPVLDEFAVGFRVMHGFSSATVVHGVCDDPDGRKLVALYVGDYDPSGLFMSEIDLPGRIEEYGGDHITLKRIALTRGQVAGLSSFAVASKRKDPRFKWFSSNYGTRCWELDAMDPRDLRTCVRREIKKLIEPVAWKRCETVNKAELESLKSVIAKWSER